jgi:hypothetical protein
MNDALFSTQTTALAALAIATLALGCGGLCLALARRARQDAQNLIAVALQLEGAAQDLSRDLDAATERANEQGCRLAWLEAQRRAPAASPVAPAGDRFASPNAKTLVTERRHRVLSLARRGVDSGSISTTLNLPRGEVELIIGLSRAS